MAERPFPYPKIHPTGQAYLRWDGKCVYFGNAMAVGLTGASVDLDMRLEPGAVMIVIKVSYASHFHTKRPLWDSSKPLPQEWRQTIDDLTSSFIAQAIPRLLTR